MNKYVYAVEQHEAYEDNCIMGVYSSEELAQAAVKEFYTKDRVEGNSHYHYFVYRHIVLDKI